MSGTTTETASCERATGDQGSVRAAHTPGPWRVAPASAYAAPYELNIDTADNGQTGFVCTVGNRGDETAEADARLIAAAPEMKEAGTELNALITRVQEKLSLWLHPDSAHDERECMNELLEIFDGPEQRRIQAAWRAAIAKATEGQP